MSYLKHIVLYYITQIGNNRKRRTPYGISWNPEYASTNNCTNLHMPFAFQSVLVE